MTNLTNLLIQRAIRRAAFEALVDRRRSRLHPSSGRFTRDDVAELLPVVWRFARADAPDPAGEPGRVAASLHVATVARAFLDALILREVERDYAIDLVADLTWRLAQHWARLGALALRGAPGWPGTPEPAQAEPPFAFCPAAATTEPRPGIGRGAYAVTRCPVADYLHAHHADDLCRAVFCDQVHAIGERAGLKLERARTIADGAPACEVRWSRR
jgi:hypothetical protein